MKIAAEIIANEQFRVRGLSDATLRQERLRSVIMDWNVLKLLRHRHRHPRLPPKMYANICASAKVEAKVPGPGHKYNLWLGCLNFTRVTQQQPNRPNYEHVVLQR